MSLPNFQTCHSHMDGKSDFAVDEIQNILYSVGPDFMVNKFDLTTRLQIQSINVSDVYYSIHINQYEPNNIILSGVSSSVEIFSNESFKDGFLAIKCFGSIYKVASDHTGKYLACASDENTLSLYESKTKKIYKSSKTHEASCVNVCFQNPKNQTSKYVCSTSCNGTINIYEIDINENKIDLKLVKTNKLGKETLVLSEQVLQPHWNETGDIIGLPGAVSFSYLKLENGAFVYYSESEINHEKDISIIHWVSNNILITVGLDKNIKIWNFPTKKLLFQQKVQECIQNLLFVKRLETIVFIDTVGQIGFWKEDEFHFKMPEEMDLEVTTESNKETTKVDITNMETNVLEKKMPELTDLAMEEIKKEVETKKSIQQKSSADAWIDAAPQANFHSSETSFFKSRRFLCWNLIGSIIVRRDNECNFLDIDFADKNFHKNIRSRDMYNLEMGDMNYCGAILASRALEVNDNEYEDEIHNDETKKFSFIQFKCFSYIYEPCDWTVKLQKGENSECVCIGNNWCAVATDFNYIRVFNFVGVEINVLTFEKVIVAMSGYENLLAYVYHEGVPVLGCQNMRLKVYDVEQDAIVIDCPVAITPFFTMSWFGFSHEGLIILQESSGIIKGLFNKTNWVTFYDNNEETKLKNKFWLIGMIDYELIGVPLGKDELEPSSFPLPQTKIIQIELPFVKTDQWWSESKIYEKILWNKLMVEHEKFRQKHWYHYKFSRDKYDHLHKYSDNILNEVEILNKEKDIEKLYVDFFRECLVKGEYERALNIVGSMIKYVKTIEICLLFCSKMNLGKIAEKINIILNEKIKKIEYLNSLKGQETSGNRYEKQNNLVDLSNLQTTQQAPLKKNKIALSSYAIQTQKQSSVTLENIKNKKKKLDIDDYNFEQDVKEENNEVEKPDNNLEIKEEPKALIQNPFSVTQNTEKEVKNIFDMMQSDSKKKRKMDEENVKIQKKIKF